MTNFAPPENWKCRKCGKAIPYNEVCWVGNGVPVCLICHKTYGKEKKPCPKTK